MSEIDVKLDLDIYVLIVEDDDQTREIIKNYLQSFGFRKILEAKSGLEGLVLIKNHKVEPIRLIISDWEMENMDGLTFLKHVRQKMKLPTPFLMCTAQQPHEKQKVLAAKSAEVSSYIVKPFRAQTLKEKIEEVLGKKSKKAAG